MSNSDLILEYISKNPGCHLRKIRENLKISMGSLQYHLFRLEKRDKIGSLKHGIYKSYFPAGVFQEQEMNVMRILNQSTTREILFFIIDQKNPTQTQITQKLKIRSPSIHWHLRRLLNLNIIHEVRDGRFKRYSIDTNSIGHTQIMILIKKYYNTIWQDWSEGLADMLTLYED